MMYKTIEDHRKSYFGVLNDVVPKFPHDRDFRPKVPLCGTRKITMTVVLLMFYGDAQCRIVNGGLTDLLLLIFRAWFWDMPQFIWMSTSLRRLRFE